MNHSTDSENMRCALDAGSTTTPSDVAFCLQEFVCQVSNILSRPFLSREPVRVGGKTAFPRPCPRTANGVFELNIRVSKFCSASLLSREAEEAEHTHCTMSAIVRLLSLLIKRVACDGTSKQVSRYGKQHVTIKAPWDWIDLRQGATKGTT